MGKLEDLTKRLEAAASENDPQELNLSCAALISAMPKEPGAIDKELAWRCLSALRKHRRFGHMRRIAQAILDDGCDDPQIYRQFAQALIEAGETVPAIGVLQHQLERDDVPFSEWAEMKGILGRAWKDRAVKVRGIRDDIAAVALKNAFEHYRDAYNKDDALLYQGINHVALAYWDRGLSLDKAERDKALATAKKIFSRVKNIPEDKRPLWDIATAGEALIAQGKTQDAIGWFHNYVSHKDIDSFALAGTIRQLTEIWQLGNTPNGGALLTPMRAKLLELPGGSFTVTNQELVQMASVEKSSYEKILGNVGAKTYSWMKQGFDIAQSVALIRKNGTGFGTGFVVRGNTLDDRLGDELFVLTNSHVVSDPPKEGAARPDDVTIAFELQNTAENKTKYDVKEVVWQSPPDQHDASLLRVEPALPDSIKPMKFSPNLPTLDEKEKQKIYIIGHPGGGDISFSYEDNELLDYDLELVNAKDRTDPCRIHYRTPTEPGSSGSPVFNGNWRTIGIHHKGGTAIAKLNGKEGLYAANEGIWIESIRRVMKNQNL